MKRTLLLISALTVFAALGSAQDDAAYTTAMKTVQPSVRALGAAITASDNAAVNAEGKKLAEAFTTINAYWKAKKVDDAIGFSQTALDAAKTLAGATDAAAQNAARTALQGTCNACHMAHRSPPPPPFTIK